MDKKDLIISKHEMPTGYMGYYWSNKENTLRYSYSTMFKKNLETCEIFDEGVEIQ